MIERNHLNVYNSELETKCNDYREELQRISQKYEEQTQEFEELRKKFDELKFEFETATRDKKVEFIVGLS